MYQAVDGRLMQVHSTTMGEPKGGCYHVIQLNLSTMTTLGTEESGHFREVLNKSQCMDILSTGMKASGRSREVAV